MMKKICFQKKYEKINKIYANFKKILHYYMQKTGKKSEILCIFWHHLLKEFNDGFF